MVLDNIPPITIVVGRNNVGKSTILHAAALAKYGPTENVNLPIGAPKELVHAGTKSGRVALSFAGMEETLQTTFAADGGFDNAWAPQNPIRDPVPQIYFLSPARQFRRSFQYTRLEPEVGLVGENALNITHQLKVNDDPRFDAIVGWLKRMDFGLSSLPMPTENPGEGSANPVTYGNRSNLIFHGSGLRSMLPIVVQGVLSPAGSVLLLEEPEVHLHRAAIDVLWTFFADCVSRGIQIIATTHSIDVLGSLCNQVEDKKITAHAQLVHVRRTDAGVTSHKLYAPSPFKVIQAIIKEDLAGRLPQEFGGP